MPIGTLAKTTKENIFVDIVDRSVPPITDLSTSTPAMRVLDSADTEKVAFGSGTVTASGMRITVLLDTTVGGNWAEGEYRLFVRFTVGSQLIVKGPFFFFIEE